MNLHNIVTVYLKELKDSLRDRRTLMSVIIIPTLVMPVMFFGLGKIMSVIVKKAQEEIPPIAIIGGADSPAASVSSRAMASSSARPSVWMTCSATGG